MTSIPAVTSDIAMDFMSRDCNRLLLSLREEPETKLVKSGEIKGPIICIMQDREGFKESYRTALKEIRKVAAGPRVKDIKVKCLTDAEQNQWGDYAQHTITIE